jgi:ferric-dicitrate binding protein FerR (iron transport regulator)
MNASPSEHDPRRQMILEGNIARLIASADRLPKAADSLLEPVLVEVRRHRRRLRRRRAVAVALSSLAAVAAVLVAAVFIQRSVVRPEIEPLRPSATRTELADAVTEVAKIKAISGLASLTDGGDPRTLAGRESVIAGEWLKTAWGSRAEVLLADQSRLVVQPHTRLQINSHRGGKEIRLDEGRISFEVTKQPANQPMTISTPVARVTVVGTALDVQVLTRSNGRKQTWVDVRSGRVELTSCGQRVVLLPNMQGIANQGEPPIARSQTAEVNELARLAEQTAAMAAKAGLQAGRAAIVEFGGDGSATVWSLFDVANATRANRNEILLECAAPDGDLEVFSLQGARFPAARKGKQWRIDCSADPLPPGGRQTLVVRVGNVPRLFAAVGRSVFEFSGPDARPAERALLQLRLPSSARVEEIVPQPVEVRQSLSRLVLTLSSAYRLPQLVHEPSP